MCRPVSGGKQQGAPRTALPEEHDHRLKVVVERWSYLTELIADKDIAISDLRRLLPTK